VGGLYARVQNLDRDMPDATRQLIAQTIYDQYKPESADDSVPRSVEGAVLSICDKADTIAGMFALGLQPTGSKDPFALRRQANGIVKTIAEHKLPLDFDSLFIWAREVYNGTEAEKKFATTAKSGNKEKHDYSCQIHDFFRERLEFYLRETAGYPYDVVNAVLSLRPADIVDAAARAKAVSEVRGSSDFASISIAFKRIKNILRQAGETGKRIAPEINSGSLKEDAERNLAAQIPEIARTVARFGQAQEYSRALKEISRIRPAVDAFFDKVMVMVEDEELRANRLALLAILLKEFSTIADFSEIVTEGKS
jgi:glycyl-tRNA synthetase beta chain